MAQATHTLSVWTEGLNEDWITFTGLTGHLAREPMTAAEVADLLQRINEENGFAATCQFILQGHERRLTLALSKGVLTVSDPTRANYQNVAVGIADLGAFLEQFFEASAGSAPQHEDVHPGQVRLLEGIIALVAVAVFGLTVYLVSRHLEGQEGFMPEPEVAELADPGEARRILAERAGIHATRIDDGEMVLEINADGRWVLYDVFRSAGSFSLEKVGAGACRPVLERGRLAILTDTQFLFHLSGERDLVFLQRKFSRVGRTREDLPFVIFPPVGQR